MQKAPITKYRPYPVIDLPDRQWPSRTITEAPIWCSVDLRDGNQALPTPMNVAEKLELFKELVRIGFKQIEIGFPSASETEFTFCRRLIEENLIPDDVYVQVLVQAREHLIRRTFEAVKGAKNVILHLYNSTNPLQRRVTFGLSKEEIKNIAVEGTKLVKSLVSELPETNIILEYSPESFSDTEVDYALEVCEAVKAVWQPTPEKRMIMNLPDTVQYTTPNVHADQIEWFCRNLSDRESVIISLHTHNDRGTGVAATELALMAGADRVEGTLFGNGERTGNLDIVTVALNMYMHGIDPQLDFSDIAHVRSVYERVTKLSVPERHPYAGDLVFTAFSGSHQDAIKKGMDKMDKAPGAVWQVPYLPIDPQDIGRDYQAIIRINSQSGKGGVAYVLDREYGFDIPKKMQPEVYEVINVIADKGSKELSAKEIHEAFFQEYVNREKPLELIDYDDVGNPPDHHNYRIRAKIVFNGDEMEIEGAGNGPINAFAQALDNQDMKAFRLVDFRQHSISDGSAADAAAYVQIESNVAARTFWGVGVDSNIEMAGLKAYVSAINRATAYYQTHQSDAPKA